MSGDGDLDSDNYDDYMFSGDEDMMSVSELEFENDNDDANDVEMRLAVSGDGEHAIKGLDYDAILYSVQTHLDDHNFVQAREEMKNFYHSMGVDNTHIIGLCIMFLRAWSLQFQFQTVLSGCLGSIEKDLNTVFQNLLKYEPQIQNNEKNELLRVIDDLIFGSNKSDNNFFLFMLNDPNSNLHIEKIEENIDFYSDLLLKLEWIYTLNVNESVILHDIQDLLRFKSIYLKIIKNAINHNEVEMTLIAQLQDSIDLEYCHWKKPDLRDRNPTLLVQKLNLILQIFIFNFLQKGASQHDKYRRQFEINIEYLQIMSTDSLALQQDSELMLILHVSMGISFLPRNENDRDEEDDDARILTSFIERVSNCRNEFLMSLKKLEEIGYSRDSNRLQLFHKLIICVFVMTSMILVGFNKIKINPFNFEEMKILEDFKFIHLLKQMYSSFIDLNLLQLYDNLNHLEQLQMVLSYLIERILQSGQTIKIWTQIAPNYSCISLNDLCSLLKYSESIDVTRNDILTVLMKSVMKGKAAIYFKIDLTKDIVRFGDDNKVPLTVCPKDSFSLRENTQEGIDMEYANDVGIFDIETRHITANDTIAFFDQLKTNRELKEHSPMPRETTTASLKYMKLANMVTTNIKLLKNKTRNEF